MVVLPDSSNVVRSESSLCGEERGVAGGDVAGARDVPLPRPRVLAVGAALQQKLPGTLAVDPHVHRPVVVAVPVHLRPEQKNKARTITGGTTRSDRRNPTKAGESGACLGLETPVFSPAALRTSRRSSGAAAIWAAALSASERERERLARKRSLGKIQ